ncbi:MAG: hypothetical protein F4145_01285 [Boseongicola sp. SB0675_bin_26]|nr:hypothetical protein [Boseongicola sp. SB0675_bin_26]
MECVSIAWKWVKRMMARKPNVQLVIKDGSTVNIVQGDQHIHYHMSGPSEVVSDKPLKVIELSDAIAISDAAEATVRKPDSTTETSRSDGG